MSHQDVHQVLRHQQLREALRDLPTVGELDHGRVLHVRALLWDAVEYFILLRICVSLTAADWVLCERTNVVLPCLIRPSDASGQHFSWISSSWMRANLVHVRHRRFARLVQNNDIRAT